MSDQKRAEKVFDELYKNFKSEFYRLLMMDNNTIKKVDDYFSYEDIEELYRDFAEELTQFGLMLVVTNVLEEEDYNLLTESISNKNFKKVYELVVNHWLYSYLEVKCNWSEHPAVLNRKILVPLRYSVEELIYGILSTMRIGYGYDAVIETEKATFVLDPNIEDNDDILSASYFPIANLNENFDYMFLLYGKELEWEFKIEIGNVVKVDEEDRIKRVILLDAAGYGIYDGNINDVIRYVKDHSKGLVDENMECNFFDSEMEELKEVLQDEYFELVEYYSYFEDEDE